MRIGMMADRYKPHVSGVTNYIAVNKEALEKKGHEVFVFTMGEGDPRGDEPNVIRSPGLPLIDTGFYFSLYYSSRARSLLQTMDVVHVHHPFLSGRLALHYCRPNNIPIVFTNHTRYDLYIQAYLPILPEELGLSFLQSYLPSFCRSIDLVISPSEGMKSVLEKIGVDSPIEVVPNGVDLSHFQKEQHPHRRENFGFRDQDIVLVYAGRLAPEKNLPFLIRSFGGLVQAFPDVKLLVLGSGPEKENLERLTLEMGIGKAVCFPGMIPYAHLPEYMAMGDAFVTASVTEVHPLSVIEAMAVGLPVLGIRSPGVSDTVKDEETGYLSTEDLAAFTAKLVRLVTVHEQRKRMGLAAKKAVEIYDINRTTELMVSHYQRLIEMASRRRRSTRHTIRNMWQKRRL